MESLNKTSSGQSRQPEMGRLPCPPRAGGPRARCQCRSWLGETRLLRRGPGVRDTRHRSLHPRGSLCAQHWASFHLHICRPVRWVFYPVLQMQARDLAKVSLSLSLPLLYAYRPLVKSYDSEWTLQAKGETQSLSAPGFLRAAGGSPPTRPRQEEGALPRSRSGLTPAFPRGPQSHLWVPGAAGTLVRGSLTTWNPISLPRTLGQQRWAGL